MKNFFFNLIFVGIASCGVAPAMAQLVPKSCADFPKSKGNNLLRTRCMIDLILDDLSSTYGAVGGGGIASIDAQSSTSYRVSLPQDERVDLLTYEFKVKGDGAISIDRKIKSTRKSE